MTLTKKVAFNTIFQIIGKVVTTALSLVLIGALTRYLGVAGYGQYTTIFAYVSFFAVIADFGFFWVLVRELAKPKTDQNKIFNNVITLKIIFAIITFLIAAIVAFGIPQYSWTVKIGIAIIASGWFWMSLNSTYVGLFQSKLEMYKVVISDVIGRIVILGGVLYLIKLHAGLEAILWIYVFGDFINFLISFLLGRKHIKFSPRFDFGLWKIILKESLPLALLTFIGLINFKIDIIIISILKGEMDVGIYGVPYKILEILIFIPGIFMGNIFPILTKYYHSKDKRFNESIQKAFDFLILLGMPITMGLIILARPIIRLIAGNEYIVASTVNVFNTNITAVHLLMMLSISIGITFIVTVFSNLLTVIGKQQKLVMPMVVVTLINVVTNFIFIPHYSYLAASITTVICEIIMLVWWYYLTHRYVKFDLHYKIASKVIISTFIMGGVLYLLKSYNLFLVIIIGMIVYFISTYLLKAFDKEMIIRMLPNFIPLRLENNNLSKDTTVSKSTSEDKNSKSN